MQRLRQLVAGTDFSECAEHALDLAFELALAAAAGITLVHVCEQGEDDLDDRRLVRCDEALSLVVARHRLRGVELDGVLRSGRPWTKLDNIATEVGASLIVIGRHGAGRGRSVEIGSVASELVRTASRPVLTVAHDFTCLDREAHANDRPSRKNSKS
jgi:nucleotide-binding universal stress UspA family protein